MLHTRLPRPFRAAAAVVALGLTAAPAPGAGTCTGFTASSAPVVAAAETLMAACLVQIRADRLSRGLAIDARLDPNQTGIIGDEFTPLTTSVGAVEAKRTAANPQMAGVMVRYFQTIGVARGDVIAIGASGSFPALILATMCAARVLDLEPLAVYSVGSSMYGANLPGFTFADMLDGLRRRGLVPYRFLAVAPGGDRDTGRGVLFDETGSSLIDETRRLGVPTVAMNDAALSVHIHERLQLFERAAGGRPIRCFVNVGGASANYGDTDASLALPPGLIRSWAPIPESPTRGLVFEFLARGVPVIHLLHVRGITDRNGLLFDPVPFPGMGLSR